MKVFRKRYMCVLCSCYCDELYAEYIHKGLCVCSNCHESIKTSGDYTYEAKEPLEAVISPFNYDGAIKSSVKKLKFSSQKAYGIVMGKMLADELISHSYLRGFDCIIPVPLHGTRLNERGYNQAESIAAVLAEELNIPCIPDSVFRIKKTKRQSSLRGIDRVENVKSAFYAAESVVRDKNIILVDDICTKGETIASCAKALKDAGAKRIIGVALCKTQYKERSVFIR